ncbi:ROK family protein [Sporosarcina sp. 6E9]|uniref:ROK family protein n=1 Tax=Sporosarcina sp. 6E9 TaxID=2819235 RepID=UPI001B305F3C
MGYVIGVDIGGTKIASVILDQWEHIVFRTEVESDTSNREKMFTQVTSCIDILLEETKIPLTEIVGMGVGVPGKVDRKNGIAVFQNNLPWRSFPVIDRLREHYRIENISLDNDVYLATLAEWKIAGENIDETFVYITISTGISCSIIHNGSFLRGAGFAGELGLFPVLPLADSSKFESLEETASGLAIQKLARKYFNKAEMTTKDFFMSYQNGNDIARNLMNDIVKPLAYGIYSVVCLLDPNKIVFGGGVVNNNSFFIDLVKEELAKYLIPEQRLVLERIHTSHFKGDSGIIGAGIIGKNQLEIREEKF